MYIFVALIIGLCPWGIYTLLPPSKALWLLFHEATWSRLLFHEEQEINRELQAAATREKRAARLIQCRWRFKVYKRDKLDKLLGGQ